VLCSGEPITGVGFSGTGVGSAGVGVGVSEMTSSRDPSSGAPVSTGSGSIVNVTVSTPVLTSITIVLVMGSVYGVVVGVADVTSSGVSSSGMPVSTGSGSIVSVIVSTPVLTSIITVLVMGSGWTVVVEVIVVVKITSKSSVGSGSDVALVGVASEGEGTWVTSGELVVSSGIAVSVGASGIGVGTSGAGSSVIVSTSEPVSPGKMIVTKLGPVGSSACVVVTGVSPGTSVIICVSVSLGSGIFVDVVSSTALLGS